MALLASLGDSNATDVPELVILKILKNQGFTPPRPGDQLSPLTPTQLAPVARSDSQAAAWRAGLGSTQNPMLDPLLSCGGRRGPLMREGAHAALGLNLGQLALRLSALISCRSSAGKQPNP